VCASPQELEREKEQMREVLRRAKEGFDSRRNVNYGARGALKLNELVGADKKSRREAKRLGLLNSDEESSDDGGDEGCVP
jgi:hypothetical protein